MHSAPDLKVDRQAEGRKLLRQLGNDDGSVTIEAALALTSLVVVSALIVGALATLVSYVAATDIAGAAARAHAIGQPYEPPRGSVTIVENSGLITATASVPVTIGEVSADAIFPVEN